MGSSDTHTVDTFDDEQVVAIDSKVAQVRPLEADDRGRISLGREFATETVPVAVIEAIGSELPEMDTSECELVVVTDGKIRPVQSLEADGRGRVTPDPDLAGKTLRVAVLEDVDTNTKSE